MRVKIGSRSFDVMELIWQFYFIMIMGLSVAIPHIQMIGIVSLVAATVAYVIKGKKYYLSGKLWGFVCWYCIFIGYVWLSKRWAIFDYDSGTLGVCRRIIIDIICMAIYVDSFEKAEKMMKKYITAAIVTCILFFLTSNPAQWGSEVVSTGITGLHRNNLGVISSFSTVILILGSKRITSWKRLRCFLPVLIAAVFCCGSRTNMLVLAMALALTVLLEKNVTKKFKWIFAGVLGIIVLGIILSSVSISDEFFGKYLNRILAIFDSSYQDSSMDYRDMLKLTAYQLILRSPIIGNGYDSTAAYNASLGLAQISAHSNYFELMACYGIVGTVLYYIMYVRILWKGFWNRETNYGWRIAFICFLILTITEYQTYHQFDFIGIFLYICVYGMAVYWPNRSEIL